MLEHYNQAWYLNRILNTVQQLNGYIFFLKKTYTNLSRKLSTQIKFLLRDDCVLCGDALQSSYCDTESSDTVIDLCSVCLTTLKPNLHCCERCALPLGEALIESELHLSEEQFLCGECQTKVPPWNKAIASFLYEYPIDKLLIALKYKGRMDLAGTLAGLMVSDLEISYGFSESVTREKLGCLIPVPLHPMREFSRGYNQAQLLADALGKQLNIPVWSDLLERVRHTPKQSRLSKEQRKKNLQQAFRVKNPSCLPNYVAIVDDVMTTGSTVEVISKVLLKAGVKRVDVWCCARAE